MDHRRADVGVPDKAAEKGPSFLSTADTAAAVGAWAGSRGAAAYTRSTPRAPLRALPCIWTLLSGLPKGGLQHPERGGEDLVADAIGESGLLRVRRWLVWIMAYPSRWRHPMPIRVW